MTSPPPVPPLVEHGRGPVNPAWPVWYRHPERLHSQVCALWRPVDSPPQADGHAV